MKTTTQKLLTAILALQALMVAGQWLGQPTIAQAHGENTITNPSERQLMMVEELRTLNGKVDKLNSMLANGEVTVKIAKEEK